MLGKLELLFKLPEKLAPFPHLALIVYITLLEYPIIKRITSISMYKFSCFEQI